MRRISVGRRLVRWTFASILLAAMLHPILAQNAPISFPFHGRGTASRPILNVAHAGASSLAPQDTIAAGRTALDLGADVWGVDVRVTRDGALILMHDETLERTTDVEDRFPSRAPWRVSDFTLDEILTLDAGSWFVEEDPFDQIAEGLVSDDALASYVGAPVPTLRDALEFVAAENWLIDIEIKPPSEIRRRVVAERLVALIEETETLSRVLVSSFDHDFLRQLRALEPAIPRGALVILQPLDPLDYLLALDVDVYLPSPVGFTNALLTELEAEGIGVILWTYNSPTQLENAVKLPGVDGIYTDFPQRLAPLLEALHEETP